MSAEESEAVVRRFWEEVWNNRNQAVAQELVTPEELPEVMRFYDVFMKSSSDLRVTIEDMFAEGNKVADRITFAGTHDGSLSIPGMNVPPTGKYLKIQMVEIWEVRDGKMAAHKGEWDRVGMMRQLGMVPGGPPPS